MRMKAREEGGSAKHREELQARRTAANWALRRASNLQILEATPLARVNWLVHGFSTRPGGASELEIARGARQKSETVLNLGFTDWDSRARVLENRREFFGALDAGEMRASHAAADSFRCDPSRRRKHQEASMRRRAMR